MKVLKMSANRTLHNEKGFSLIEMIVVLIIIGTISSIAYGVILLNAGTFRTLSTELSKRWELRNALRIMREDFSQIDPDNILNISKSAKGGRKIFFRDIQGNKILYMYNDGTLRRKQNSQKWEQLASGLKEPPFTFLDAQSQSTKNKKDVAYIKVRLVFEVNEKKREVEDTFFLRNRWNDSIVKKEKKDKEKDKEKDDDDEKDEDEKSKEHHGKKHKHG